MKYFPGRQTTISKNAPGLATWGYVVFSIFLEVFFLNFIFRQLACIEAGKMYSGAYSTGKSFDILRTKYLKVKRACAIYFNDHKQTLNDTTVWFPKALQYFSFISNSVQLLLCLPTYNIAEGWLRACTSMLKCLRIAVTTRRGRLHVCHFIKLIWPFYKEH